MNIYGEYFYGNKISEYGLKNGYVDYGTLAKAFDAVLNNEIMENTYDIGYWEMESGTIDNSDEIEELENDIEELQEILSQKEEEQIDAEEAENDELFDKLFDECNQLENEIAELEEKKNDLESEQDNMPEVFQWYIVSDQGAEILKECNEVVYYNSVLDMYLWGVTHYGTAWAYVLTDIPCFTGKI